MAFLDSAMVPCSVWTLHWFLLCLDSVSLEVRDAIIELLYSFRALYKLCLVEETISPLGTQIA